MRTASVNTTASRRSGALRYVAITRARRRLYLTHAQSRMLHGQLRYNVASRFLDEVPAGMVAMAFRPRRRRTTRREPRGSRRSVGAAGRLREDSGWRIGQSVKHSRFGLGVIIDAEGRGTDARVQVNFRGGRRQVARAGIREAAAGLKACPAAPVARSVGDRRCRWRLGKRLVAVEQVAVADIVGNMQRRDEREQVRNTTTNSATTPRRHVAE